MKLTSIASGSSGNCVFVSSEKTKLLVDVGISAKRIETGLLELGETAKNLSGILITHEHIDHINGLGVMMRRYKLPAFATVGTIDSMRKSGKLGEVDKNLFYAVKEDETFQIDDILIDPSTIWHDAADPVCYSFYSGGVKASIATDLGNFDEYLEEMFDALENHKDNKSKHCKDLLEGTTVVSFSVNRTELNHCI